LRLASTDNIPTVRQPIMRRIDVIVIGGGQAGLAMSRCFAERGVGHIVLERGRVAERWRTGSWDSLRLLTPNWLNLLPGGGYDGPDPDGFMRAADLVDSLCRYAAAFQAPIETGVDVLAVEPQGEAYRVTTSRGAWQARGVVVATGQCQHPLVPAFASALPARIQQLTPADYRRPSDLPDGPALVVGASASGVQLAEEIHRSGRPVTLSVGRHTRIPRRYRGRDILAWMHRAGVLDDRAQTASGLKRARRQPSLQLVGRSDGRSRDLGVLQELGIRIAGRAKALCNGAMLFAEDLALTMEEADRRLARLLNRIDDFVETVGLTGEVAPAEPLRSIAIRHPVSRLDLQDVSSVIWATGYRREYPWLKAPVLGPDGEIEHTGGVTARPGLYVLGLPFLRRRKSNFIGGVGDDASELAQHLVAHLAGERRTAA
jgi:putative flavoprotein involved in K+ transport